MIKKNKYLLPTVSVILSVYNSEKFLDHAIESVLNQEYPRIEIIAVNDGSTDNSLSVLKKYSNVIIVDQDELGESQTRNNGITKATSEYIAFLDPDDLYLPGKLRKQVAYLEKHKTVPMCISLCAGFLEPGLERPDWVRPGTLNACHRNYSPSGWLMRSSLFKEVGLLNTQLNSGTDFEFIQRLRNLGIPVGVVEEVLWKKRVHASNASAFVNKKKIAVYYHELLSILKKKSSNDK